MIEKNTITALTGVVSSGSSIGSGFGEIGSFGDFVHLRPVTKIRYVCGAFGADTVFGFPAKRLLDCKGLGSVCMKIC